jgi:type II secretory ATPase GspE/PulE/Tfp pilus assembly ATPase PilB-like protein
LVLQTTIVRTVDLLIAQGTKDHASDIHIEPQQDKVRIRYRINPTLLYWRAPDRMKPG